MAKNKTKVFFYDHFRLLFGLCLFTSTSCSASNNAPEPEIVYQGGFSPQNRNELKQAVTQCTEPSSGSYANPPARTATETDQFLADLGYTRGLRIEIMNSLKQHASRIWVLDNSGSMNCNDGSLFLPEKNKRISCTRWEELQNTMKFHLDLSEGLQAPCYLQLLNPGHDGQQFMSCSSSNAGEFKKEIAASWQTIKNTYPAALTPLSAQIHWINDYIRKQEAYLREKGQRVCVILATDGLPSDNPKNVQGGPEESFRQALNSLHELPVWVVVRLLTDQENVVDYYNNLDQEVELPLEVLDDWKGEAREVHQYNPWINYTPQLHHAREMGMRHPVLDLMDEKAFCPSQVMQFLGLLFGEDASREIPHPGVDKDGFMRILRSKLASTKPQFNVITNKVAPLIDVAKLKSHLKKQKKGDKGCVIS